MISSETGKDMALKSVIYGVSIGVFTVYLDLWIRGSIKLAPLLTSALLPILIASIIICNCWEVEVSGS